MNSPIEDVSSWLKFSFSSHHGVLAFLILAGVIAAAAIGWDYYTDRKSKRDWERQWQGKQATLRARIAEQDTAARIAWLKERIRESYRDSAARRISGARTGEAFPPMEKEHSHQGFCSRG